VIWDGNGMGGDGWYLGRTDAIRDMEGMSKEKGQNQSRNGVRWDGGYGTYPSAIARSLRGNRGMGVRACCCLHCSI
jgi:hypothetical protein